MWCHHILFKNWNDQNKASIHVYFAWDDIDPNVLLKISGESIEEYLRKRKLPEAEFPFSLTSNITEQLERLVATNVPPIVAYMHSRWGSVEGPIFDSRPPDENSE